MFRYSIVFLCAVLVLSNVDFIQAGKYGSGGGSRHSYPRSGGLSGGSHGYPSSGGSHSYPSSGGSHGYPSSGGLSGNGRGGYPSSGGGSHAYPNSGGGHKYPASGGNSGSGSHGYPNSGSGLSGNNHGNAGRGSQSGGTTNIHHHYHYSPPQQIHYASPHGGPAMNYPVYRGTPPSYVYQYKDSGSKYSTLLTGLALFNLGALAGGAVGYGIGHQSSSSSSYNNYRTQPGEECIFGIKKDNGDFEETRIECQLISSFIYAEQAKQQNSQNQTTVVTTVTNTTVVNTTNAQEPPTYIVSANGTLVPPSSINPDSNSTNPGVPAPAAGGTVTSSVLVTTTNTTVVNAVDVKGKPIDVTPGMQCYVMRKTPSSRMRKDVPCGLLTTYADKSLKPNSAARNVPAFTVLAVLCAVFVAY